MPGPCAGKSDTVMLDSKYSMTPKFVKQKSHLLHSSIKFANPGGYTFDLQHGGQNYFMLISC